MLQKTLEAKDERFFYAIKKLLIHESPKVRALAIENLYFLKTEILCFQIVINILNDRQTKVIAQIFKEGINGFNCGWAKPRVKERQ